MASGISGCERRVFLSVRKDIYRTAAGHFSEAVSGAGFQFKNMRHVFCMGDAEKVEGVLADRKMHRKEEKKWQPGIPVVCAVLHLRN